LGHSKTIVPQIGHSKQESRTLLAYLDARLRGHDEHDEMVEDGVVLTARSLVRINYK
jgi:hypothetical protein